MMVVVDGPRYREALEWLIARGIQSRKNLISPTTCLQLWDDRDAWRSQRVNLAGLKMTDNERMVFKLTFGGGDPRSLSRV